uniref:Uncharacterized protein n=1 Tax=Pseudo-nitzschia australis TaxID=44445 RepID=A0A6U9YPY2_9STRA|mmetsp:Transcript_18289/g.38429  ORF Transcript_18289/g.38429 Transcript_18289/m.38429 type:complete len:438 (-) Transcript_18289:114-1427(-)
MAANKTQSYRHEEEQEQSPQAKMDEIVSRKHEFPQKIRVSIDEALQEMTQQNHHHQQQHQHHHQHHQHHQHQHLEQQQVVDRFLSRIERKLVDLLWENHNYQRINPSIGLNSDHDTEQQVETALRFFPRVLSTKNEEGLYPIQAQVTNKRQSCNLKAVSFVPLFARLGIELKECEFEDWERGGLLLPATTTSTANSSSSNCDGNERYYRHWNVLEALSIGQHHSTFPGKEHLRLVDETCLAVMKRLRDMGLFQKEDIQRFHLIHRTVSPGLGLLEQQFYWLMEWDPTSFMVYWKGYLPIHHAAYDYMWHSFNKKRFLKILAIGLIHFPVQMAGLFHMDAIPNSGITAYQRIRGVCGEEAVNAVFRCHNNAVKDLLRCLMYIVATNEENKELIHLDGAFLILQRVSQISHPWKRLHTGTTASFVTNAEQNSSRSTMII